MIVSTYRAHGSTSNIERVFLYKDSGATAGTEGDPLTGLTSASSGLAISVIANNGSSSTAYTVAASNVETITTAGTYAAPTASKCRFKEVAATAHPGLYEIQFADARYAVASAKYLDVCITGAADLATCHFRIYLDVLDAAGIRAALGMAAATYDTDIGNLPTVAEMNARTFADPSLIALESTSEGIAETLSEYENGTTKIQVNAVEISGDSVAADNAEAFFDGTGYAGTNNVIPTVTTLTGHTAQTGDSFARIGATGSGLTSLASQTSVNTIDTEVGAIDTVVDAIKVKTDQLTFGATNTVNANITYVNEIEVTGDGEPGTEWNPV